MPYLDLNQSNSTGASSPRIIDGVFFAHAAVQFASLGLVAGQKGWRMPQLHLYALAIELAFKSLALRAGATLADCRRTSHRISDMVRLIERHGSTVPEYLKTRLTDDQWFRTFLLLTRYPTFTDRNTSLDNTIFVHSNYPEMIAAILEIPCKWSLQFEGGSALAEIRGQPGPRMRMAVYCEKGKKDNSRTASTVRSTHSGRRGR